MDEGQVALLLKFHRAVIGVVIHALDQLHLGAVALCCLHLGDRRAVRDTNQGRDAAVRRCQRNPLRMVSCGTGDDAMGLFLVGQLRNLIIGAAHLKGTGHLQIFGLEIDLALRVDLPRRDQVGFADHRFEHISGMIDLIQC